MSRLYIPEFDESIDFTGRDFIPLKGMTDYSTRNKRFIDAEMSDYETGHAIEIGLKFGILMIYNCAVLSSAAVGLIAGLEKILN